MKFRTFISALAVVAGLLVVLGLGILGALTLRSPLSLVERGGQVAPQALQFVPKQSPLVASVLVRPDQLGELWQYLAATPLRQDVKRNIQQIEQTLLAGTGLSYERDILPWLGDEITAAVVTPDLDQDTTNGNQPGYLVAFDCRDSQNAKAVLELFWQNRAIAGDPLTFEDFSGTRLIYTQPKFPVTGYNSNSRKAVFTSGFDLLATSVVANQFVLAANHPEVLRQALTAAQSADLNLQSDWRYRQALNAMPGKRVGLLTFNMPVGSPWLNPANSLMAGWSSGTDKSLNPLEQQDGLLDWGCMSLRLSRQGLIADLALAAAPGHRLQPQSIPSASGLTLSQYLPDQPAIAAVGENLETLWHDVSAFLAPYANRWAGLQPLAGRFDDGMVDEVSHTLLEAASGNYAVGMRPRSTGSGADWILVTQHSPAMETTLQQLVNLAEGQGIGLGRVDIRNHPTTVWTRLSLGPTLRGSSANENLEVIAQVTGLHTQLNNTDILTTSPGAMDAVLAVDTDHDQPPAWTEGMNQLRQPNAGYLYINWPALQASLSSQDTQFRLFSTAASPLLKHVKTITLTTYRRTDTLQTGGIFFELSNR